MSDRARKYRKRIAIALAVMLVAVMGFDHWLPYMLLSHYKFAVPKTAFMAIMPPRSSRFIQGRINPQPGLARVTASIKPLVGPGEDGRGLAGYVRETAHQGIGVQTLVYPHPSPGVSAIGAAHDSLAYCTH